MLRIDASFDKGGKPFERWAVQLSVTRDGGEHRHGIDGLSGMAKHRRDLGGRHAASQQLARATVARAFGNQGGHQVAGAGQT